MRRTLLLALLLVPFLAFGQDVAEDELREFGTADIDFINYEGPHDRIDTDEEIRAIGRALAQGVARGFTIADHAGKYRVIHAVDPAVDEGLDADIIVLLPNSRVDHIDNVRRIISGFLMESYGYNRADGDLLARFVTIYNAVARGNMTFFRDRYKDVVLGYLVADKAGLARRYDEWPGRSQIVIPLGRLGGLGAVDPGELADEAVVEELRTQEDMGIEERQELVDLTERVISEREAALDRERAAIEEEEARIAQAEADLEAERQRAEAEGRDAEELAAREQEIAEDREAVDQRRDDLAAQEEDVAELTSRVREERERIASDTRALLDEREISDEIRGLEGDLSPIYFIQVREVDGVVLGQLVQINPVTGLLLNRSVENSIVSRSYNFLDESLLVIAVQEGAGRLATFDVTSLEETGRGEDVVFLGSSLAVHGDPGVAYAVVSAEGDWYVGRFDADLVLLERSVIAVNPYTTFAFGSDRVWVQTKDDRIIPLSLDDLRVSR